MRLPPYVLLEIIDWLPVEYEGCDENESLVHVVSHVKKIRLIESVHRAYKVRLSDVVMYVDRFDAACTVA